MFFTRSTKYSLPSEFSLNNHDILEVKKEHWILGIILQDDLQWKSQVKQMVGKAAKTTWVLRCLRVLGVDEMTLVAYWKAEGRVHHCNIWPDCWMECSLFNCIIVLMCLIVVQESWLATVTLVLPTTWLV